MDMNPFVKWAGGKRQLLPEIKKILPSKFNTYFEPFVGGGALLLDLQPEKICINDFNKDLISVYKCLRSKKYYSLMVELCEEHESKHNKDYFYLIRDLDRKSSFLKEPIYVKAARCLYLNKACFNGLYRVSSKGYFNVPFNGKEKIKCFDEVNLKKINEYFLNAKPRILNTDFEKAVKTAKSGDLVYFDPPYDIVGEQSFTSYTKNGFGRDEQIRLFNLVKNLTTRGVKVIISNAKTDFILDLYKEFRIHIVKATRRINSDADKRGTVEEVIITNYERMNSMYIEKTKTELIEIFVKNILESNRGFSFFVNWNNCLDYEEFEIELNAMNVLIRSDNIKTKFYELSKKLPSFISTFPLLFALSRKERENNWGGSEELIIANTVVGENDYLRFSFNRKKFKTSLSNNDIDTYYDFFVKIGLKNLFDNMLQKSVVDYVIGVLCGLDSNGRKNRGGTAFEDACEPLIKKICDKHKIELISQKQFKILSKRGFNISEDIKNRKADFILLKGNKAVNIEVDYFFRGGSKPEEIINSYMNRKNILQSGNVDFILITDGNCWDNTTKSQLVIGFNNLKITNFYLSKNGYLEELVTSIFNDNEK